jgi:hypothetical protein
VPTGFTPNGDGRNDGLKPTVYGITKQYYFSVSIDGGNKFSSLPKLVKAGMVFGME